MTTTLSPRFWVSLWIASIALLTITACGSASGTTEVTQTPSLDKSDAAACCKPLIDRLVFFDKSVSCDYSDPGVKSAAEKALEKLMANPCAKESIKAYYIHNAVIGAKPALESSVDSCPECKGPPVVIKTCQAKIPAKLSASSDRIKEDLIKLLVIKPFADKTEVWAALKVIAEHKNSRPVKVVFFSDMKESAGGINLASLLRAAGANPQTLAQKHINTIGSKYNIPKLGSVEITIVTPTTAAKPDPLDPALKSYWQTVFSHYGVTSFQYN